MTISLFIFCFIQGITEFLPISSQGHLIFFNHFFPITDKNISIRELNIIAHFGSLLAVILYYYKDVFRLIMSVPNFFRSDIDSYVNLLRNLIISSIPIYICGYSVSILIDGAFFESLTLIGWTTLFFGILLFFIDKNCLRIKSIDTLPNTSALLIGLVQCLAIIPGVSRSGAVITVMRLFGFTRVESANYSNLLSIPAIMGAMTYLLVFSESNSDLEKITNVRSIIVLFVSFFFSYIFIHFMVSWVRKSSFAIFMYYRIILGMLILISTYFQLFNVSWDNYFQ
ncbi:undecaprenyl-diphosphate phosphatase [Rickettsiales bacterium]|nr:undecaprenyl-diphosphate phosphatase [Rickettsiales bacterium]